MKKDYFLPVAVLIALFLFSLQNGAVMAQKTARWIDHLRRADSLVISEDWNEASAVLSESHADWSGHQLWLRITLPHDVVNSAESMYRRALAFAAEEDSKELRAEIASLLTHFQLLAEMERLSIQNIF